MTVSRSGCTIAAGVLLAVSVLGTRTLAHKGMTHPAGAATSAQALAEVNASYLRQVKPIFHAKCFDCHGSGKPLPWYAGIPGAKQLIRSDIRTARKHLDMDRDFPFGGHASPLEHLESLAEVIKDGSMPPWRYRIAHRGSALTPQEIAVIQAWIDEGRKALRAAAGAP